MGYFYAAAWLLVALILIFKMKMGREHKIFYFLGGYFVFMSAWWVLDSALEQDFFGNNIYGWGFRIITAAVLALSIWVYLKEKGKKPESGDNSEADDDSNE